MLVHPQIDPIIFSIGPVAVRWYGLMYLLGFAAALFLLFKQADKKDSGWTRDQMSDVVFYCAMGVVLGGRVGYVFFYKIEEFLANPLFLFDVMSGGMSFHGGLLGVLAAIGLYAWRHKRKFWSIVDMVAIITPIGLGAGRIGNFINGELWGRATDSTAPWIMIFPNVDSQPRHPSQLYQFLLEGVAMFVILWLFSRNSRPRCAVSGLFAVLYGAFRFIVEFYRQPDSHLQELTFGWMTRGQVLSVPLLIVGVVLLVVAYTKNKDTA